MTTLTSIKSLNYEQIKSIKHHIINRLPCILKNYPHPSIDISSLKSEVQVEMKVNGRFGCGVKTFMDMEEFSKRVDSGELYLNTQTDIPSTSYHDLSDDMVRDKKLIASLLSPPLDQIPDFNIDLDIMEGLVLQTTNLWVGGGTVETSSGLHHDFHDNVYLLLKGTKRFTIFSPSDFDKMYLYGSDSEYKRFENGLVAYGDDADKIRSDGAYIKDVAEWKLAKAEHLLDQITEDPNSTPEAIEIAEEDFDIALEGMLQFQDEPENPPKRHCPTIHPPSFSKAPPEALRTPSPLYPLLQKASAIEVTLVAGDTLYLPAGYFHEVRSMGDGGHVALNYWYAPTSEGVYSDQYWEVVGRDVREAIMRRAS